MIRNVMDGLNPDDVKNIKLCFDEGLECVIEYDDGKFIAVNLVMRENMEVLESRGKFCVGRYLTK